MQRRQLWLLNAVLAGFAILMAMRLRSDWQGANERYTRLAGRSGTAAVSPVIPVAGRPPVVGTDVVARNLFSPDRNNDRPQEAHKVQPPVPVVIGTLRLGDGYEALMSEAGAAGAHHFRRVKQGDQLGPYTVAEIRDEAVVVEFQGQKTTVNVYQSAQTVARATASVTPPVTPAASAGPVVETSGGPAPPASVPAPASTAAAVAAGAAPATSFTDVKVTIEGNRKRYERNTAFGPQVWYEDIKK